jgi:hypothetical protein
MTDALTYGAAATDLLQALQTAEPTTAAGAEAANPVRVRAVASDGVTPVAGATIAWSTSNGATLSACGGTSSCSVLTDESGIASTGVTPTAAGTSTITAALAPASYTPAKSKQATVTATETALDLAAVAPTKWIGQGATLDVPLVVRVLNMGAALSGVAVNFRVAKGTATLSATSGTTDDAGYALITAHLVNHSADVQVTACAAPNNLPCQTFTMFATPSSRWLLQAVSGSVQVVPAGQPLQLLTLRVTDGSLAANPVMGVPVVFNVTLERVSRGVGRGGGDDNGGSRGSGMPVILGTYQVQAVTGADGTASLSPSVNNVQGYCDVLIAASAGPAAMEFHLQVLTPMGGNQQVVREAPSFPRHARYGKSSE